MTSAIFLLGVTAMLDCIIVGTGGFIGTVCRYLIGLIPVSESGAFPIKTLCINIAGAFLIGLVAFWTPGGRSLDPKLLLLLRVGICGGFTTFSTFAFESFELLHKGASLAAVLYIALSVLLGVGAIVAARAIAG